MESPEKAISLGLSPVEKGHFAGHGFLLTLIAAPLFGLIWAWVAEVIQAYFAPLFLFPLLLGVFAGLSIVALVRFAQIGHRPTIFLAAVLCGVVAAGGLHFLCYWEAYYGPASTSGASTAGGQDFSALIRDQMRPSFGEYMAAHARRGRPMPFGFIAQEGWAWLSWGIDMLLTVAGAVIVILPAVQLPYCNHCGTWYRTIRSGKIDSPTALRLAALLGIEGIDQMHAPRYRLSSCQGGCTATRCELSWEEDADGTVDLAHAWLDPAGRSRVVDVLDGLENKKSPAENGG